MLENVAKITRVVLACGTVDLRKGIDGLSVIIGDKYKQNPFEKGTLFLFCGRRSTESKGCSGWAMDFFCCINGSKLVRYPGQEPPKKLRILLRNNSIT